MEIIFLGTSSGTPTKQRNVSATAIKMRHKKGWCLVDCGEGTQHQLLHTSLTLKHLTAIFITHVHGDHSFGLPGLLASAAMSGRTEPLIVVAPQAIQPWLVASQTMSDTFLSFEIQFVDVATLDAPFEIPDMQVSAWPLSHRVSTHAYSFTEIKLGRRLDSQKLITAGIPSGPIWGQLQNHQDVELPSGEKLNHGDFLLPTSKPRKIIIGGDNDTPELLTQAADRADVLVHESTYTEAVSIKVGAGPQHSSAKQVAEFAAQVQLPHLILTHFSARYQYGSNADSSINEIEAEATSYFPGQLYLANDFDHFVLNRQRQLHKI